MKVCHHLNGFCCFPNEFHPYLSRCMTYQYRVTYLYFITIYHTIIIQNISLHQYCLVHASFGLIVIYLSSKESYFLALIPVRMTNNFSMLFLICFTYYSSNDILMSLGLFSYVFNDGSMVTLRSGELDNWKHNKKNGE